MGDSKCNTASRTQDVAAEMVHPNQTINPPPYSEVPISTPDSLPPYTEVPKSVPIADAMQNCPRCNNWHDPSISCRSCGCNWECSSCSQNSSCTCNGQCAMYKQQNSDNYAYDCYICPTLYNPGLFSYMDNSPCNCNSDCCNDGCCNCDEICGDCGDCFCGDCICGDCDFDCNGCLIS